MTTGIILQARMGSSRLPGKVLAPLLGRPMLAHILERLALCAAARVLVLATTTLPQDDAVAALGAAAGIPVFRGDALDVLDRYVQAARAHALDVVVRATADNPLVHPPAGDAVVARLVEERLSYACTTGYPKGVGLEAMTRDALERSHRDGHAPHHREHVNEYILEHPELFAQATCAAPPGLHAPALSLTVDTPQDLARVTAVYDAWQRQGHQGVVPVEFAMARLAQDPATGGPA